MSVGPAQTGDFAGTQARDEVHTLYGRSRILIRIALASIIGLGLAVRLYGLTAYGIWFDEGYHIQLVQLPDVPTMLDAVLSNPPSAPLYVLLLRAWTTIFGYDDLSVRMLSVLLGTLTLPAVYWLGRVMVDRTAGLVGALLLAISPYAVEFSQEAALYALASLATTLALAAGWRWRNTGDGLATYVILGTIAIYSHYVVAAILGLFMLLGLYILRKPGAISKRHWVLANVTLFLLWSPWLISMSLYWIASPLPRASLTKTATEVEAALKGALVQFSSGTAALHQGPWLLERLGLLSGGALLLAGCVYAWRHKIHSIMLIVIISVVVFFLPALASAITGRWLFVPHFMLFLLPALLLVLATGAFYIASLVNDRTSRSTLPRAMNRYVLPALLVPWLAAQIWGLALFHRHPPHGADGLRELASVLRSSATTGDIVFVTPPSLMATLRQYYPGELRGLPVDFDLRVVYRPYVAGDWYRQSTAALDSGVTGREGLWLVYRPELDQDGKFLLHVTDNYKIIERHNYIYADLYLVESP